MLCVEEIKSTALSYFEKVGIVLTEKEKNSLEIADFRLSDLEHTGLQLITYVNTERVCAKELVLLAHQTCPEHRHPSVNGAPGKEETFRCRYGTVYLYVDGEPTKNRCAVPPEGKYTVFHEIILREGEQYTLLPNTLHWFQAAEYGAVVSEFSTHSTDEFDVFSDERIVR